MKASKMLISTLKEAPNEAIIPSHILLLRAGMMKKLVAGVYNYLPLGLRVLNKIERIIREEMDKSGALEILSSAMQPKELWEESGRWKNYGPELIRFKDRHDRDFCLGPTHEEIFTDLVRTTVKSYKNLPLNIYQIQTKYRDEIRPRFGLMRAREFIMKDAYSFDVDEKGLEISYQNMYETYNRIFKRVGLKTRVVLADTGAIGGSASHQFMAISDVGESDIVYCEKCHYAADGEKAESVPTYHRYEEEFKEVEEVTTPNQKTIEEISSFLNVTPKDVVKTLIYVDMDNDELVAALIRGDRFINEIKLVNALGISEAFLRLATEEEINNISVNGFVGPVGLKVKLFVDEEVTMMKNFVVGANKKDAHLINVNYGKDFEGQVVDLRMVQENDECIRCHEPLKIERGIEVGQIFKLGTKYSNSMNCTYLSEEGKTEPMVMGCYGIGVTRTLSAVVEQYHDEHGIIWPKNIAPYHVVVIPIDYKNSEQQILADKIYEQLNNENYEVVLDDRNAKAGFKFKDWDLIGIPYALIVGRKASEGIVELKTRNGNLKEELSLEEALNKIKELLANVR
ncbi:TPA: proline--tRNA ligase [bacterium]|nr:proline--tRNA ligase [bacterium]